MSDITTNNETTNRPSVTAVFQRVGNIGGVLGLVGVLGIIAAFVMDRHAFYTSYLFAYVFWICFTLGCFGMTLLHHMVRGYWGLAVLRIWEAGSKTLPIMALLFLPILFGMFTGGIYEWTDAVRVAKSELLQKQHFYLNQHWWTIRAVSYFVFWILVSRFLNASSLRQDETREEYLAERRQRIAAPSFLFFMISVTFAFTDWVMSLDTAWYSTIYGLWFAVCMGISALGFANVVVGRLADRKPYNEVFTVNLGRDLGNLMLMLTMLWAYTSVSQFLIIWSGNLPEEISYYVNRFNGPLLFIGTFLVVFQFFVPFVSLLSTRSKRTPSLLATVAGWLLFMRLVDVFWTVTPFFRKGLTSADLPGYALDLGALAAIGGIWLFVWSTNIRKHALIPLHDPRLVEAYLEAQTHHA